MLDELVLGGEVQESSKKNVLKAIAAQDLLQEVSRKTGRSLLRPPNAHEESGSTRKPPGVGSTDKILMRNSKITPIRNDAAGHNCTKAAYIVAFRSYTRQERRLIK